MTARRVNGQTYREWRTQYLVSNNLTLPMDLEARRRELFAACPHGFFPSLDTQRWATFVNMDRGADQRDGQVYLTDPATLAPVVDEYVQLAFDEFREVCIRRASLAAVDLAAIRHMVQRWAEQNRPSLDVDLFVNEVKMAAGL